MLHGYPRFPDLAAPVLDIPEDSGLKPPDLVGLHLTFVITGVLFAVSEKIGHKAEV